jgi:hypothetical protein
MDETKVQSSLDTQVIAEGFGGFTPNTLNEDWVPSHGTQPALNG